MTATFIQQCLDPSVKSPTAEQTWERVRETLLAHLKERPGSRLIAWRLQDHGMKVEELISVTVSASPAGVTNARAKQYHTDNWTKQTRALLDGEVKPLLKSTPTLKSSSLAEAITRIARSKPPTFKNQVIVALTNGLERSRRINFACTMPTSARFTKRLSQEGLLLPPDTLTNTHIRFVSLGASKHTPCPKLRLPKHELAVQRAWKGGIEHAGGKIEFRDGQLYPSDLAPAINNNPAIDQ